MKTRSNIVAALSALSLTLALGCVGDLGTGETIPEDEDDDVNTPDPTPLPDDEDDTDTPEAAFLTNVEPVVSATCGVGGGCHFAQVPTFLTEDVATKYTVFTNQRDVLIPDWDEDANKLVTNGDGTHYDALFTDGNLSSIKGWIVLEKLAAENGGGGGPTALAKWSGCMNYDEWVDADVADAWADKGSGDGDCDACHNLAAEGFMASNQDRRVFDSMTKQPSIMHSYFYQDEAGIVQTNRPRLDSVALRQAPHEVHPNFNVEDGNALTRLQQYYDLTMIRLEADNCEPPRF